jgi:hypothetical protein
MKNVGSDSVKGSSLRSSSSNSTPTDHTSALLLAVSVWARADEQMKSHGK